MTLEKLMFPYWLETVPARAELYSSGLDDNTGAPSTAAEWEGLCVFSEKGKRVFGEERAGVSLSSAVVVHGDIAPELPVIAGGRFTVFPGTSREWIFEIKEGRRPRNPDGSVHHTWLGSK